MKAPYQRKNLLDKPILGLIRKTVYIVTHTNKENFGPATQHVLYYARGQPIPNQNLRSKTTILIILKNTISLLLTLVYILIFPNMTI